MVDQIFLHSVALMVRAIEIQAKLQVASAFLSGKICESQISQVAKKLLKVVGQVAASSRVMSKPVAYLTEQMGEL